MTGKARSAYEEMAELDREIRYHADLYFNKDTQEIHNHIYDDKVQRFEELCDQHPDLAELFVIATKAVPIHAPVNEGLAQVRFVENMLSLKKALTLDQVMGFLNKEQDYDYLYEIKLDGLKLRLTYVNGNLTSMATRGDSMVGEDVFHALVLFDFIPLTLNLEVEDPPSVVNIEGEAFITLDRFHRFNEISSKEAANPRNAVSGWIRSLPQNQNPAIKGQLSFAAYQCDHRLGANTYLEMRYILGGMGFNVPALSSLEDVKENKIHPDFPVDGIVIKVNNLDDQDFLGKVRQYPKWAIAYKFPDVEIHTTLGDVVWATAASGRVVPVAHYEPVVIGGVTCTKALLDNYRRFMSMELQIGDTIGVTRNGDVTPRLHRVIEHGTGELLKAPELCPTCDSVLEKRITPQSGELFCTNVSDCQAQLLGRCIKLAGKKCLDIQDLGPITLSRLLEEQHIQYPCDVLVLTEEAVGEKIYKRIQKIRDTPQARWVLILALGLPGVDVVRAKLLAAAWPEDMPLGDFLRDRTLLEGITGISAGVSLPIIRALDDQDFITNMTGLQQWLTINNDPGVVYELKACLTGSLGQTREVLIDYFSEHGIELSDKLTKDCSLLIVGERPSDSKLLKATEQGIRILRVKKLTSIDDLINLVKTGVSE